MIFLGIDPGIKSGGAVLDHRGRLALSRQIERRDAHVREAVVDYALSLARREEQPLIVVREDWQAGGNRATPSMFVGLGRSWGQWEEQLLLAVEKLPPSAVHKVKTATWRSVVLGGPQRSTEDWDRAARKYVSARFGARATAHEPDYGPDEVVAICLAVYGAKRIERPKRSTWWKA